MTEPHRLSDALTELFQRRGFARVESTAQLNAHWKEIAGPQFAEHTKVLALRQGVLDIAVTNAGLLAQLASFHRGPLLAAMQKQYPDLPLRDLRFRLRNEAGRKPDS